MNSILIIDDVEADLELIKESFVDLFGVSEKNDCEFQLAKSGEEALGIVKEKKFDLVILDTKLPGIDGFETCRQLKETNPQIKIILLTGVIDMVNAGRAREAGADEFCVKTMNYTDLKETLQKAFGKKAS